MKRGNLHQRLSKLETQLAIAPDVSGFAPYTEGWRSFWWTGIQKRIAGEDPGPHLLPFEVFQELAAVYDALLARSTTENAKS